MPPGLYTQSVQGGFSFCLRRFLHFPRPSAQFGKLMVNPKMAQHPQTQHPTRSFCPFCANSDFSVLKFALNFHKHFQGQPSDKHHLRGGTLVSVHHKEASQKMTPEFTPSKHQSSQLRSAQRQSSQRQSSQPLIPQCKPPTRHTLASGRGGEGGGSTSRGLMDSNWAASGICPKLTCFT